MILSKEDFNRYILAEERISGISSIGFKNKLVFYFMCFCYSERYILLRYLKVLRRTEYYFNCRYNSFFGKFLYFIYFRRFRKMSVKLQINIPLNTIEEGLLILHIGTIIINGGAKLGANCILQPGVIVGQKDSIQNVPIIGNNVYFGPGSMVIGKVNVGDNVKIAPNSVVVKDVENGSVVSGVPAKLLSLNGVRVS